MIELQPSSNFAQVQPPESKPSSPLLMIILVILVIFSLAGMGFLYWQNQQLRRQTSLLIATNKLEINREPNPTSIQSDIKDLSLPSPTATMIIPSITSIPNQISQHPNEWKSYKSPVDSFQLSYPDNGITEITEKYSETPHYYRFQNYIDKGGNFSLKAVEYYIEISVSEHSATNHENLSCRDSFKNPQVIKVGDYMAYQGYPECVENCEGGHQYALCVETANYNYWLGGRDGTSTSSIIKSILARFKIL